MGHSPLFKVYGKSHGYVASCKYPSDAACLVGLYGAGSTVKYDHAKVLWREGKEEISASESYDIAADTMLSRLEEFKEASWTQYGNRPD